ncbi:MAG: iron ABC transporter permease [Epulopiscium sp.]|nr:iron ABC transporter permease [Candidatus Epulonipiscium sp.]
MKQKLKQKNYIGFGVGLFLLLIMLAVFTLSVGAMKLPAHHTAQIVLGKLTALGNAAAGENLLTPFKANEIAVIWEIRLPRVLCGMFIGGGLAVAGTVFQAILRNPLADPYTLGVSTGAAFGASVAILCNVLWAMVLPVTVCSMATALVTLAAVIAIAQKSGGLASHNLIISGIIVGSILSSGISFLKMMAGENVSAIVFWLMGSLSSRQWSDVAIVAPIVTLCTLLAFYWGKDLDIMLLGDETALSLGVNANRIRLLYLILGACITAACVSVSGIIGFIGLVVPHILRFRFTPYNRVLIPLSALVGAILLCLADNASRLLCAGEIPVGVLTTLIGGPFFVYIFIRRKNYGSSSY